MGYEGMRVGDETHMKEMRAYAVAILGAATGQVDALALVRPRDGVVPLRKSVNDGRGQKGREVRTTL